MVTHLYSIHGVGAIVALVVHDSSQSEHMPKNLKLSRLFQ